MKKDDAIFYSIIFLIILSLLSYQTYNLKRINDRVRGQIEGNIAVGLHRINSDLRNVIEINDEYQLDKMSISFWTELLGSVERAKTSASELSFMYLKPSEESAKIRSIEHTLGGLEFFLNKTVRFIEIGEPFEIAHNVKFKKEEDILEEMQLYRELLSFFEDEEYYKSNYFQYTIKHWDIEAASYINTPFERAWK